MIGKVVAYHEVFDFKLGVRYFKGENGNVCLPHPTDPRISRSILINKFSESLKQTRLGDFS